MSILLPLILGASSLILGSGMSHIQRATDRKYNAEQAQINRDFNAEQAEINRNFQAEQAQIQRDYETQMSNTAIDRQVAQLERNGLNSAAYFANGGSGASTPTGASASGSAASGSAASTSSPHTNLGNIMSGAASMIQAFNYDKDSGNNINLKQALGMISNVASIFK